MSAISVGGFIVVALLAWFLVSRTIGRPLAEITRGLDALMAGDTSVEINVTSNDEIGLRRA